MDRSPPPSPPREMMDEITAMAETNGVFTTLCFYFKTIS